jgi:hypothetical protein
MKTIFDYTDAEVEKIDNAANSINTNDVQNVIDSNNVITETLGKTPLYRNFNKFDELMKSDEPIVF